MFFKKQIISDTRLPRGRYWLYFIFISVISECINIVFPYENIVRIIFILTLGFFLIYFTIKRLHDLDRSGLHLFYLFIPFYNIYLMFIILYKRGTHGNNKYGEDPIYFKDLTKNKL